MRLTPLVPLIVLSTLGACTGLLGVDFEGRPKGEGGSVDGGDGGNPAEDAGPLRDGSAGDADSPKVDPDSGLDRAWSRWPISQSFPSDQTTKTGSLIYDSVTGLVWPDTALDPVTFDDAEAACADLDLQGFTDWRVPTRIELATLINYLFIPAVSADILDNTIETWTSSTFKDDPSRGWYVAFMSGAVSSRPKSENVRVRCVRAGLTAKDPKNAPPDRFTTSGDVIIDKQTSLTWQKNLGASKTFAQATTYCAQLSLNGQGGFRLPEIHELHSIVDERSANPALASVFPSGNLVWSNTKRKGSVDTVWTIDEYDGHTLIYGMNETTLPRCVR